MYRPFSTSQTDRNIQLSSTILEVDYRLTVGTTMQAHRICLSSVTEMMRVKSGESFILSSVSEEYIENCK